MNKFTIGNLLQAAAIAGIAATSVAAMTTPSMAYSCKASYTQAAASAKTQTAARAKARDAWSAKVKNSLGLPWSVWSIASNKSITCSGSFAKWTCTAKAKPCLYVVQ